VFEDVCHAGAAAAPKQDSALDQFFQGSVEFGAFQLTHRFDQLLAELTPNGCTRLSDVFADGKSVEPRDERVL
jgi:hypothetical protein